LNYKSLKRKVKIHEHIDIRRRLSGARAMLDSILTPDRAMPKLLLKH
jgi:hypothetical protein